MVGRFAAMLGVFFCIAGGAGLALVILAWVWMVAMDRFLASCKVFRWIYRYLQDYRKFKAWLATQP